MERKMMGKIIAIDAGHGHNTPGRRCDKRYDPNQTHEWDLNNKVASLQQEYLEGYGISTIRLDDPTGKEDVSLASRVKKANANKCILVVSNHHNAGGGNGLEAYYDKKVVTTSKEYKIYQSIYQSVIDSTGQNSRGLKSSDRSGPGDLAILRDTVMPAILIEAGFMDNVFDTPKIISDDFARKYARGVVDGIVKALDFKEESNSNDNNGNSIVDYLKSIGVDSSFANRKQLAKDFGINGYRGTASENLQLMNIIKTRGIQSNQYYPAVNSRSLVDALKMIKEDSSFMNRTLIAKLNGINNYTGTTNQNIKLLSLLKEGKLRKV